jgi:hypothetical protein
MVSIGFRFFWATATEHSKLPSLWLLQNMRRQSPPGDFNRDGHLDFAAAADGATIITLGNGDGTFTGGGVGFTPPGDIAIATGEFHADGLLDLVVANSQDMPGVGQLNRPFAAEKFKRREFNKEPYKDRTNDLAL